MAKVFTIDDLKALKKIDLPKAYQRSLQFPMDPSSLFASKADADLYAAGGADARGLGGTSYAGQLVAVVEDGKVTIYKIETDGTLGALSADLSGDLAALKARVDAILEGADASLDTFKEVKDKFDSLKDLVVSGGTVREATEEDAKAHEGVVAGDMYIILSIKDSEDLLFIPAKGLVDEYTAGDYVDITDNKVSVKIADLEAKLVDDSFAKQSDIATAIAPLATTEALNEVKTTAEAAANKADANETNINNLTIKVGESSVPESRITEEQYNALSEDEKKEYTKDEATGEYVKAAEAATGLVARIENLENQGDHAIKSVDTTASNGVALTLDGDKKLGVSVVVDDVKAALDYKTDEIDLKDNIGEYTTTEGATVYRYAKDSSLQAMLSDVDARVKANTDSIAAAVAGGVTAVKAGNGINVDATVSTQPVVSVKLDTNTNLAFNDNKEITFVWMED